MSFHSGFIHHFGFWDKRIPEREEKAPAMHSMSLDLSENCQKGSNLINPLVQETGPLTEFPTTTIGERPPHGGRLVTAQCPAQCSALIDQRPVHSQIGGQGSDWLATGWQMATGALRKFGATPPPPIFNNASRRSSSDTVSKRVGQGGPAREPAQAARGGGHSAPEVPALPPPASRALRTPDRSLSPLQGTGNRRNGETKDEHPKRKGLCSKCDNPAKQASLPRKFCCSSGLRKRWFDSSSTPCICRNIDTNVDFDLAWSKKYGTKHPGPQ